ncbi:helix-turn-helix domain-containing protein [Xanthovirga aplysinae]|uniref:helix-turn-helix domain-containing protein n=1 Tax=Xanthovirga aplysinae TaxID=2529853 RepID=UPI0012BC8920|nr:transcriptional regulator [Xanthovirga aplysinae]MTI29362.1 transcriptional regulator [Xanthovirga aplysinae]
MQINPIKTEKDYEAALKRIEEIFDAVEGPEANELEILSLLVDNYENEHHPIEAPDPIEAIKIRMEEKHLKQKDLIGVIGSKGVVSEVLHKRRGLSIHMIRNIQKMLNIPASILIQEYKLSH